jgi:hypothetical protein
LGQFERLAGVLVRGTAARAGVLAGEEIAITKTFAVRISPPVLSHTILSHMWPFHICCFADVKLLRTSAAHKANAHPEKDQNNDDQRATGNAKSLLAAGHSVPHALAQMEQKDAKAIDDCPKSHDNGAVRETDAKTEISAGCRAGTRGRVDVLVLDQVDK